MRVAADQDACFIEVIDLPRKKPANTFRSVQLVVLPEADVLPTVFADVELALQADATSLEIKKCPTIAQEHT